MSNAELAPSIMCDDLTNVKKTRDVFNEGGVPWLHVDIMDGHFVPNLTFGPDFQKKLHAMGSPALDTHLMITNPGDFIEPFAKAGSRLICIHVEGMLHVDRLIGKIRDQGCMAGVALNPATPLSSLEFVLPLVDVVMLMLVNPGFYGQKMVPYGVQKVAALKELIDGRGLKTRIEVDGNVSTEKIPALVAAGADMLVAGTSCLFKKDVPLADSLRDLKKMIAGL